MFAAEAFVDVDADPPELVIRARSGARFAELACPLSGIWFVGQESPIVLNAEDAPLCICDAIRNAAAALLEWREHSLCPGCGQFLGPITVAHGGVEWCSVDCLEAVNAVHD